ncbi:MAG: hypothetical protein MR636_00530 [Clostridiales bacterium]|nr:hypothetical protein [Clostridiales bacterium]
MNSKAIRKQLLAAVAMVLVAAVALGSSTYAWFASNNKVTASTANISATAQNALSIMDSNEDWRSAISLNQGGTATSVSPIHFNEKDVDGKYSSHEWYAIANANEVKNPDNYAATVPFATYIANPSADAVKDMFIKKTEESTHNVADKDTDNNVTTSYVIGNEFQIKATGTLDENGEKLVSTVTALLPTTITTVGEAANIYKAFHVVYIVTDPTDSSKSVVDIDFGGESGKTTSSIALDNGRVKITATVTDPIVETMKVDTAYDIVAYLYLEGEDSDCYTSNATSVQNLAVTYNFEKVAKSA